MPSPVDICNMALSRSAARSTITSLMENNPEANACLTWYDADRRWLLRQHRWNFARKQGILSLLATAPGIFPQPQTNLPWPFMPWAYSYAYPQDCVKFNLIVPTWLMQPFGPTPTAFPTVAVPFVVSGTEDVSNNQVEAIFTNQPQAVGVWTRDIRNVDLWDSQFLEAMVFLLASHICVMLSGNVGLANTLFGQASTLISAAAAQDGNEGLRVQNYVPDWIRVRGYGADFFGVGWNPYGGYGYGNGGGYWGL